MTQIKFCVTAQQLFDGNTHKSQHCMEYYHQQFVKQVPVVNHIESLAKVIESTKKHSSYRKQRELTLITCVKFLVDRFRGYGVLTPPKLPFPIDLLRHRYNCVRTAVRHCDIIKLFSRSGICDVNLPWRSRCVRNKFSTILAMSS